MAQNPFDLIDARLSNIEGLLLEIKRESHKVIPKPDTAELLTVPQAAEFLSLSIPTIYGLLHKRELPAMKRGKRVYFKKSELFMYLEKGRKKTITELEEEAEKYSSSNKKRLHNGK